jgi:ATP-dependent Clp protease ATP-binding subunit ClpC
VFARFTPESRRVIELAEDHARALGRSAVGPEHLLLALLAVDDSGVFVRAGLRFDGVRSHMLDGAPSEGAGANDRGRGHLPMRLREVFRHAFRQSALLGAAEVRPLHLALALVDEPPGEVAAVLRRLDVKAEAVRDEVLIELLEMDRGDLGPTVVRLSDRVVELRPAARTA